MLPKKLTYMSTHQNDTNILVLLCAGKSTRMGFNKVNYELPLNPKWGIKSSTTLPLWIWTYLQIYHFSDITWNKIIFVFSPDENIDLLNNKLTNILQKLDLKLNLEVLNSIKMVYGGDTRQKSVYSALNFLKTTKCNNLSNIFIHDIARPFIQVNDWKFFKSLYTQLKIKKGDCVILGGKSCDTLYQKTCTNLNEKYAVCTKNIDRNKIIRAFTPQVAQFHTLYKLHEKYKKLNITDDASLFILEKKNIYSIFSKYASIKLTYKEDIEYATFLINNSKI